MLRVLILRHQVLRPLSSTASAQKPPTTLPGQSSLPLTRIAPLGEKSAPRLRMIMVRNVSSVPPRCIALSMERIQATILRIATLSRPKVRANFKKNSREFNLIEKKASQEKAKYLNYKSLNKASSRKKTPVILEDSESDSSSSEEENVSDEGEEHSTIYDSESRGSDKISDNATGTEEEA